MLRVIEIDAVGITAILLLLVQMLSILSQKKKYLSKLVYFRKRKKINMKQAHELSLTQVNNYLAGYIECLKVKIKRMK